MEGANDENTNQVPLLEDSSKKEETLKASLLSRVMIESEKQWRIVGPEMIGRLSLYGMLAVSTMFAGHIGNLELASVSVVLNVIIILNYGFLLGMASALETLCGQAYGAKKYHMLGIYMQRSWIVLFLSAILALPLYLYAAPILKLLGQPSDLANQAGCLSLWFIPTHFSFVLLLPVQRFLQCQLKNKINAYGPASGFIVHVFITWLFVGKLKYGVIGIALAVNFSWWVTGLVMFTYAVCGGCPDSWNGFSFEAFSGLLEFFKLSAVSGVMLCLEFWYYRILIIMTGNLKNAEISVDALSICMNINGWEQMIPMAFFVGTGVRVANELGSGNGTAARFATIVASVKSIFIGLVFWALILGFSDKIALIFTSSQLVLEAFSRLSILLAFSVLLNSIQPILSGVAIGSGWQGTVAYVNLGSYYLIGLPAGLILGWTFNLQVLGIWAGMIGGTAVQTMILIVFTLRCDWDKEAKTAAARVSKWSSPSKQSEDI